MLKQVLIFLLSAFIMTAAACAQQKDSPLPPADNSRQDSLLKIDSTYIDSVTHVTDSSSTVYTALQKNNEPGLEELLQQNIFLNSKSKAVSLTQLPRKRSSKDATFYALALIFLFFGILRVTYSRYFTNLIRVFFNTSLRQGQLTDQLIQAGLPSLLFNVFFMVIGGWYIYLLLGHSGKAPDNNWRVLLVCIGALSLIYTLKYSTLKFAGWLTGYQEEADTYIFIVFLINKIISICLLPVVVIIPFSQSGLVGVVIIISYIMIALMFIMRFFRSYGLLQTRLKVSGFHFLLYIIAVELLPLLLIYRGALVIMGKTL